MLLFFLAIKSDCFQTLSSSVISRDALIDRPVVGIGRFLALKCESHVLPSVIASGAYFSHDRPGPVTGRSVSRLADSEPMLLLPAAQAETSQPRAHSQYDITVASKHVVSCENYSNFNGIQWCSCGSVVEHCVSSAKIVGLIPREHTY